MTFAITVDLRCDSCTVDECTGASCRCCAGTLSKACAIPQDGNEGDGAFVASAKRIRISHDQSGVAIPDDSPSFVAIFAPPSIIDPVIQKQRGDSSGTGSLDSDTSDSDSDSKTEGSFSTSKAEGDEQNTTSNTAGHGRGPGRATGSQDAGGDESEEHDERESLSSGPRQKCGFMTWIGAATNVEDDRNAPPMNEILPQIHPSLAGLLVKGIISTRNVSEATDCSESAVDFVLIEVPKANSADIVATLIEEVHGDSMASAPHAIIKVLQLSRISFASSDSVVCHGTTVPESAIDASEETERSHQTPDENDVAARHKFPEIPSCPLCLHRIDPRRLGWPRPKNQQLCSQYCAVIPATTDASTCLEACSNTRHLTPWPSPTHCRACSVIWEQWKLSDPPQSLSASGIHLRSELNVDRDSSSTERRTETRCFMCGMKETLWVCLTCGVVGCGRYSNRHAKEHNNDTGHPFSLELVTQRVWDYATGTFVQRGDLLDCPSMMHRLGKSQPLRRMASTAGSDAPPRKDADGFQDYRAFDDMAGEPGSLANSFNHGQNSHSFPLDDSSPKKATMIGEEYEVLIQSALEDQAQHYEGEISRLIADLTAERVADERMSHKEISEIDSLRQQISDLRSEADSLSTQLLDAQGQEAGHRATYQRLIREQTVSKDLLDKIKEEAQKEHEEGKAQIEDMEQQVADLTANLKMAKQIAADKELSNAQIFGTTSLPKAKTPKRGKKNRRSLRNKKN